MKVSVRVLGKTSGKLFMPWEELSIPRSPFSPAKTSLRSVLATGLLYDLGMKSSSRGMKSLPSVLPRPGHLLSYPTERLFRLAWLLLIYTLKHHSLNALIHLARACGQITWLPGSSSLPACLYLVWHWLASQVKGPPFAVWKLLTAVHVVVGKTFA